MKACGKHVVLAALFAAASIFGGEAFETGLESISDVRVAPILASKWTQDKFGGEDAFNLYLPNRYPSGCVVAAFAQIMRYWRHPSGSVAPGSYLCWRWADLFLIPETHTMKGGVYDWDLMPLVSDDCTNDAQREMLARLSYDLCVSTHTVWSSWSGTYSVLATEALKDRFGYASAYSFYPPAEGVVTNRVNILELPDYRNAILASLDAGMPVVLGFVNQDGITHQAVVDGYGFNGGTEVYCHLNCGWAGTDDRWYNLNADEVTDQFHFTALADIAYNIHPTAAGDVISGRVLDSNGSPVPNVAVSLAGTATGEATSNAGGIYFFRVPGKGKYVISATHATHGKARRTVAVDKDGESVHGSLNEEDRTYYSSNTGVVANQWGVDLVLSDAEEQVPFAAKSAAVFDGWLLDDGEIAGTVLVKAGKANRSTGESKLTATVLSGTSTRKLSFRGTMGTDGSATLTCRGQADMALRLGETELEGEWGGLKVKGARNLFTSKDKAEVSSVSAELGPWLGAINVAWPSLDGGWNGMTATVAKKGKVKVSGTLANGTKVSVSAQAIRADTAFMVPVVNAKKVPFAFCLSIPLSGGGVTVTGLPGAVAGKANDLASGSAFQMDPAALCGLLGDSTFATYLPDGLSVRQSGTKWVVADGARAGKVVYVRGTDEVDADKAGANPAALKLSFTRKTGAFKGSFKAYQAVKGKPKAVTVAVFGVLVDGVGYGTATIKKLGGVTVEIRP